MSNLDGYIGSIRNDIIKFNSHVQTLLDALKARGETTQDLLSNLFKAYAAVNDRTFVKYIADCQSKWEDGEENFTPTQLMRKAANKFKTLKTKEIWEAPSPEEEKLLALEARFTKLNKKLAKKRKSLENDGKASPKSKAKAKNKKKEKPKWMFVCPKAEDLKKPRD